MARFKKRISRFTLSTVSLAIIAGIGGFLGAIAGGLFELMSLALFNAAFPALEVIPAFIVFGMGTAFAWGLRVVVQGSRSTLPTGPHTSDTRVVPTLKP